MERQIPGDPHVAIAEFDAITASERDTWLDFRRKPSHELTPKRIALITAVTLGSATFLAGFYWMTERLSLAMGTVVSIGFLAVFLTVVAPRIDRRQMGIARPAVPPPHLRAEVARYYVVLMAPMLLGIQALIPASLAAAGSGRFWPLLIVNVVGLSLIMIASIWWGRRMTQKIETGWEPRPLTTRHKIAAACILFVVPGIIALGGGLAFGTL